MKNFYLTFPKVNALRSELTWTHYRLLLKIEREEARNFYMLVPDKFNAMITCQARMSLILVDVARRIKKASQFYSWSGFKTLFVITCWN